MTGTFYEFLKSNYKPNCPIFAKEICFQEMSPSNIRYHLAQLEEKGYIEKAEPGIYYFPETDITGAKVSLSSDDIAYGKYIRQTGGKCTGFYSGYTFANHIGLTMQVPYVKEICSNAAPAPVREVTIQNKKYLLRRPPVSITDENVDVLQLLDCLKNFPKCADEPIKDCSSALSSFCKIRRITKEMVDQYIGYYPKSVYATIYWTEVEFYVSA